MAFGLYLCLVLYMLLHRLFYIVGCKWETRGHTYLRTASCLLHFYISILDDTSILDDMSIIDRTLFLYCPSPKAIRLMASISLELHSASCIASYPLFLAQMYLINLQMFCCFGVFPSSLSIAIFGC
jgi:hypothetical protein